MDNVINDTSLTLTSYDNLVMTDGSLTMPDGGYSPTRPCGKRPIEKRRHIINFLFILALFRLYTTT